MFKPGTIISQYSINEEIGSGAFAHCYHALAQEIGCPVAIKIVEKKFMEDPGIKEHFIAEGSILPLLDHPYIQRIYDVLNTDEYYGLVFEYIPNGTLLSYVNERKSLKEVEARRIFIQIFEAIRYMQKEHNVTHRDLKLENILIDTQYNVKLIDFGFAVISNASLFFDSCGSPAYVAPEIILRRPYTSACDIWSLGVLLFGMLHGRLPFDGADMSQQMRNTVLMSPDIGPHVSKNGSDLLLRLLEKDPAKRITLDEIADHPWVACGINSNHIEMYNSLRYTVDPEVAAMLQQHGIQTNGLQEELKDLSTRRSILYHMAWRNKYFSQRITTPRRTPQRLRIPCHSENIDPNVMSGKKPSLKSSPIASVRKAKPFLISPMKKKRLF